MEPDDVMDIMDCDNRREDWWTADTLSPRSYHQLREYAENYGADPLAEGQLRLIAETVEGEFVGVADFYELSPRHSRGFIGLCVAKEKRCQGYGKEILSAILGYNREFLGLETLAARIATDNRISLRLFEKAGFTQAGLLPRWHRIGRRTYDIAIYINQLSEGLSGIRSHGR